MSIVYLVHDLGDAAVHKRVRMLCLAGQQPVLMGFRRGAEPVREVAGVAAIDLGRTEDARLARRAGTVLAAAATLGRLRQAFSGARVILARNLEMLLLARLAQRRFAPGARLIYESLDVHGMLVGDGRKGRMMRALEHHLLRACAGLVVSSPAFLSQYFERRYTSLPPAFLLENKVLEADLGPAASAGPELGGLHAGLPAPGEPWRIGWFGVIRCRRSLDLLRALVLALPGRVEVDIRGRPARNVLGDFDAVIAATPGLRFHGPYDRARDLASIYGAVHLTWAMDFYEAGANSDWLLPNRLYEGGAQASLQIAATAVETGRWLARHGIGLLLDEPIETGLPALLAGLTLQRYAAEQARLKAMPRTEFIATQAEIDDFAAWLEAPRQRVQAIPA